MEIQFDEAKHEYYSDGKRVPGVTEILSPITASGYSKINPAVLEHAAMKGTLVHEWCEMYDYGCADESVPSELAPYCAAYADFIRDYRPKWEKIEEIVAQYNMIDVGNDEYYEGKLVGEYAGRLDRMGLLNDRYAIVDIKTIAAPNTKNHISVCCQTAAYAKAIGKPYIAYDRYALYLKPDGTYRLLDCREYELKNGFSGSELFASLLTLYQEINRIGRRKK